MEDCPATELPEYAFIGRSNVGKSSLINMLTGRKKLAKTSSTPGKTQLINHFLINDSWYIVDLPGYGWAQVSKTEKAKWKKMTERYFFDRSNLSNVFVLVDIRHDAQKIDLNFINWLGEAGVPFSIIFTKADKLSKNLVEANVAKYKKVLLKDWDELPPIFVSSSTKELGKENILDFIHSVNESIKQ